MQSRNQQEHIPAYHIALYVLQVLSEMQCGGKFRYFIVKGNNVHRLILLRAKTVKCCHSSAHIARSSFQTQISSKTIGVTANIQHGVHEIHTLQNALWCHPCHMSIITLVQ